MQPAATSDGTDGDSEITLDNFYAKKEQVPKFWRGSFCRWSHILSSTFISDKYDKDANKFWDKFYQVISIIISSTFFSSYLMMLLE
jgi:hypothetical protein